MKHAFAAWHPGGLGRLAKAGNTPLQHATVVGLGSLAKAGNTPLQHGTVVGLGEYFITMVVWCSGGAWEFSTGSGGMVQCWGLGV